MKDKKYVNFSEEYELNHHLRKANKRQTKENREVVKAIGDNLKSANDVSRLKHGDLEAAIKKSKSKLE